jgi:predicted dienelactone hydrolase
VVLAASLSLLASCEHAPSGVDDGDGGNPPGPDGGGPNAVDADPPGPDGAGPAGADPSAAGTFAVYKKDENAGTQLSPINLTVFGPSDDGGTSIAAGAHPLIIISPGFQLPRSQYTSYGERLASHGFVAIAQDFGGGLFPMHTQLATQTKTVIDWALGGGGGLQSKLDAQKIGLAGHSLGGKISMLTTSMEPRVKVVVGWDPVDAGNPSVTPEKMSTIKVPVVLVGETTDTAGDFMPCAPADNNFQQYYNSLGSPAVSLTLVKADHMDFLDNANCGFACDACKPGTADPTWVRNFTLRTTTAAFRRYLGGESAMDAYLTGTIVQQDVMSGEVTVQSK